MKSTKGFLIVLIALAFAIFLNHPAFGGDTYYVPDDFPTIQDAIDAAFGGDTVIVRAGTYTGEGNRNITIDGKVISVESESGPENTIIDCEGAERGFYLKSLGSFTKLDGFKIINGSASNGAGIFCDHSSPSITNCTISGNSASSNGGGIYCYSSSPSITNCILYFDSPYEIYGSPTVTYSDIMGGYEGEGNIDKLPSFIGGGDYHLEGDSPCIDAGTSEGAPDTDIDGELRPQGAGYDMGADECDGVPPPPACKGDFDNDGDVDGSDLAVFAAEFGRTDCPCER